MANPEIDLDRWGGILGTDSLILERIATGRSPPLTDLQLQGHMGIAPAGLRNRVFVYGPDVVVVDQDSGVNPNALLEQVSDVRHAIARLCERHGAQILLLEQEKHDLITVGRPASGHRHKTEVWRKISGSDRRCKTETVPPAYLADKPEQIGPFDHPQLSQEIVRRFPNGQVIVMAPDYSRYPTLAKSMDLPVAHRLKFLRDALAGLEELHRQGYCHSDVKPGNMLNAADSHDAPPLGVLADFDGAIKFGSRSAFLYTPDYSESALLGGVRDQEILWRAPADAASDIFSAGMVLAETSYGKPFHGNIEKFMKSSKNVQQQEERSHDLYSLTAMMPFVDSELSQHPQVAETLAILIRDMTRWPRAERVPLQHAITVIDEALGVLCHNPGLC